MTRRDPAPNPPAALDRRVLRRLLDAPAPSGFEELLSDPVTGLPTLMLLLPDVRQTLAERKSLGFITVSIAKFSKLEEIYGWESFDHIVRGVASCLKDIKDTTFRQADRLAELTVNGNVFVLVLSPPRTKRTIGERDLARLKVRVSQKLDAFLAQALRPELLKQFGYFVGGAVLKPDPSVRVERLVYRIIDEALAEATTAQEKSRRGQARELRSILSRGRIRTVYQPIVDLKARRVVGYEALSRGPRGPYQGPDLLFKIAYETDQVWALDRLCRARAARGLSRLSADQLLFVNLEPLSVFDPTLATDGTLAQNTGRVVFEITEHAAIADFATFRQGGQLLKRSGFKLAVDDVGAAYAGLRVITEVEADFIKLDMALTRGAHNSQVKLQLIRAISRFCAETNVPLIVEGVETAEELGAMTALGIHLVQGYLFGQPVARPGAEPLAIPELDPALLAP